MKRKIFNPYCQETGPCADNCHAMVVGETGQGKTFYVSDVLRQFISRPAGSSSSSDTEENN